MSMDDKFLKTELRMKVTQEVKEALYAHRDSLSTRAKVVSYDEILRKWLDLPPFIER